MATYLQILKWVILQIGQKLYSDIVMAASIKAIENRQSLLKDKNFTSEGLLLQDQTSNGSFRSILNSK